MPAHASNLTDLGKALVPPVSRRSIDQWKRDDPDGVPQPKPDGRHVVKEWQAYMERKGLKRADEALASGDSPFPTVKASKEKEAAFKARKLELEVLQKEGKLLNRSQVEKQWGTALTSFRKAADSIAPRAAKLVSSAMTEAEIAEKIQDEVDHAMRILEAVDYLES
jgi:hypothetical protein